MKKQNLKTEIEGMLEQVQQTGQYIGYHQRPMVVHTMESGNFRASFDILTGDIEHRLYMEKYLRKRAAEINRGRTMTKTEIDRRSNNFQKALAFINEHRHLIPFFRFVYEFQQKNPTKGDQEAVREWRRIYRSIPEEVGFDSDIGCFHLGHKMPSIGTVAYQIPVLPKAWLL